MNKFLIYAPRANPSKGTVQAIVVDMDHTVCHANHRNVYDFDKADTDVPDSMTLELIKAYLNNYPHIKLLILTAREDVGNSRKATSTWLLANGLNPDDLFMRPLKDHRHSNEVKKEIMEKHILPNYNVRMVFEDSKRCADTYKEMGLKVIMPEISA